MLWIAALSKCAGSRQFCLLQSITCRLLHTGLHKEPSIRQGVLAFSAYYSWYAAYCYKTFQQGCQIEITGLGIGLKKNFWDPKQTGYVELKRVRGTSYWCTVDISRNLLVITGTGFFKIFLFWFVLAAASSIYKTKYI